MKVLLLAVGRSRGVLAAPVAEYEERASRHWNLETVEVEGGAPGGAGSEAERVREAEAERILARLPAELEGVALTREGKGMSSRGLASWLRRLAVTSAPGAAFVIGGPHGLHESVLERCRIHLGLSPMTLPHQMARLLLAEQLYRAGTILEGRPYHKGGGVSGGGGEG